MKALCCLSVGDPLFIEQLLDMEPKTWLPWVLKKMVSPLNRQAHDHGSIGLDLLWQKGRFSLVKNGFAETALYDKLGKLYETHRLKSCLALIPSFTGKHGTQSGSVFIDQIETFRPFSPPSSLPRVDLLPFAGVILLHHLQSCFAEILLYM